MVPVYARAFTEELLLDTWVFIAAGGVFFFGILVYVMIMIFLPEWVGISGKVAREAEESHRGDQPSVDDEPKKS